MMRRALIAVALIVAIFSGLTARLFIWPARGGVPAHVSAIVEMAATDDPIPAALRLARQHRAPVLLISRGTRANNLQCPPAVPGVRLVCFYPSPATTQGEAEFAGRMAARYHWKSVVLVTTDPQASRGRLRLERCFPGHIYVTTSPVPLHSWPHEIAYEWAAMVKALAFQRGC
jgi:hypothetical protein